MADRPLLERIAVVPLDHRHDRREFRCGVEALDRYLREQASQDARRSVATVLVAEQQDTVTVSGFYTLAMAGVLLDRIPEPLRRKMPRYPTVPAVRLGRLAVSVRSRGLGLGAHLLMDAMARSLRNDVAWAAFLVDAKDEAARSFYTKCGFQSLLDDPNHLFLARRAIDPLLGGTP